MIPSIFVLSLMFRPKPDYEDVVETNSTTTTLRPLEEPRKRTISQELFENVYLYAMSITIGLGLTVSVFLVFPLKERTTKAKHNQIITGVSYLMYWTSNGLADGIVLCISITVLILVFVITYYAIPCLKERRETVHDTS